MSKTTIFPTAIKKDDAHNRIMQAIYIFNRWRKMLQDYGKLDPNTMDDDLLEIDLVLKDAYVSGKARQMIATCRDSVLPSRHRPSKCGELYVTRSSACATKPKARQFGKSKPRMPIKG